MKILLVQTAPGEIYLENMTYNIQPIGLASALVRAGHECDIACCADSEPSVKVYKLPDGNKIKVFCFWSMNILKNGLLVGLDSIAGNYDIIQPTEYNQLFTWHMAKKYKDKVVIYHGPYYAPFNKRYNMMTRVFDWLLLKRYRKLDTSFITKSNLATQFLNDRGLKHVKTAGVGLNTAIFEDEMQENYSGEDNGVLKKIKEFGYECRLLYIGQITPRRNSLFLVDVLHIVRNRGIDASLIVVGNGTDDYKDAFFGKVDELGLNEHILYFESIEQKKLPYVYNSGDIFLLPTHYDIFGMVLLEAMYFGLPVISSPNGGTDVLIKDGENGFVDGTFDVDKWSELIIRLYNDKELGSRIGNNAANFIREKYTWDALVPAFIESYESKMTHGQASCG